MKSKYNYEINAKFLDDSIKYIKKKAQKLIEMGATKIHIFQEKKHDKNN